MCTGQLSNFVCYLHRNHPELHGPSAPGPSKLDQPSGTLQNLTVRDLIRHLRRNPLELCLLCAPDSSETLSAICTGTIRNFMGHLHRIAPGPSELDQPSGTLQNLTVRDLIRHLHRNHPELHGPSAPGPSELDQPSGTLQHPISHLRRNRSEPHQLFARNRLHRNPSEPHQPSAPEPSGTLSAMRTGTLRNSSASCPGTVRNLIGHLHRNPQQSAPEGSGTLWNLLRNLVLQLHRIAPELFWAKDPIASFAAGEKEK